MNDLKKYTKESVLIGLTANVAAMFLKLQCKNLFVSNDLKPSVNMYFLSYKVKNKPFLMGLLS